MGKTTLQREYRMDILRIVCCFLIVLLHFSSSYWYSVPIGSYEFNVMTIYNSATRVAVPIFIMQSGYFLLDPNKEFSIKKYFMRPLKLLGVLYIWSAFYAFQGILIEIVKTRHINQERARESLSRFIHGHYHMWFCFLVVGYYVLLPIARKIAEDIKVLSLFIILWIVFAFIIPCVFSWIKMPEIISYFEKYEVSLVRGYFGYFLLGYYIRQISIKKWTRVFIYGGGFVSIVATAILTISQSQKTGTYIENWFSPGSPLVLTAAFAIFLLFKNLPVKPGEKAGKVVVIASGLTFFTYMFHIFVLEKLNLLGITTISFNPVISIPVLSISVFLSSMLFAWGVSKIPGIRILLLNN